jgi:hypothetical protein
VIISCYAAILLYAAAMITTRYLAGLRSPNDFNGGMAAFGDLMLDLFIGFLLLVPNTLLAFAIRDREQSYTTFAKVLFVFSLTSPLSFVLTLIPAIGQKDTILGDVCLYRAMGAPMVLLWLGAARLLARFRPAKKLTFWAMVIEAVPLIMLIATLFVPKNPIQG